MAVFDPFLTLGRGDMWTGMEHDFYAVSQPIARLALIVMVLLTMAIAAAAHLKLHWSGWWIAAAAALTVPAITSLTFARFRWPGGSIWDYLTEVVLPLGLTIGLFSAATGFLLGWAVLHLMVSRA